MNKWQRRLMDKPSLENDSNLCVICGRPAGSRHHIVPRSAGGEDGPTIMVCGSGNESGCHGRFHDHLIHLDWNDMLQCWEYLITDEEEKFEKARRMSGWMPLSWARVEGSIWNLNL